jgi:hypothetical protein
VERDDKVEIAVERADPAMGRAVLEIEHAGQRPPLALAVDAAAPPCLGDQAGPPQAQSGHRVRELVVVPPHGLLVERLHREVAAALLVEDLHAARLRGRRPPRRRPAQPPLAQPLGALFLAADEQPAEMPPRHARNLAGLLRAQPPLAAALHRLFEPEHENLP